MDQSGWMKVWMHAEPLYLYLYLVLSARVCESESESASVTVCCCVCVSWMYGIEEQVRCLLYTPVTQPNPAQPNTTTRIRV